jgi:hypothetical protein
VKSLLEAEDSEKGTTNCTPSHGKNSQGQGTSFDLYDLGKGSNDAESKCNHIVSLRQRKGAVETDGFVDVVHWCLMVLEEGRATTSVYQSRNRKYPVLLRCKMSLSRPSEDCRSSEDL